MMVSPPLVSPPPAPTPLVTRHAAPSDISSPHIASCAAQANGSFGSSPTLLMSHSTPHISSTHLLVAHPHASVHTSHPHVALHSVRSSASPIPSSPPHNSPFNVDISHAARSSHPHDALHVSRSRGASHPEQANVSSHSSSIPIPSCSSAHPSSSPSLPHRKKRSRRCFVCGGTGKHRLNPRFCPRTFELISKHLAMFDANFRLVSFDGSPLPMTRHPGGVAAHLLSPRRPRLRTTRVSPRSISKSPGGSHLNPLHVPRVPHAMPAPTPASVPFCVLNTVPASDLYTPHTPPTVVELPRCLSTPDHSFEANPPHLPHAQRPPSPPFQILDPIRKPLPHIERLPSPPFRILDPLPRPETPSKSTPQLDNVFFLLLFDCLILSPSWRCALAGLIDAINRLNLDDDIPALQKIVEPLCKRFESFIPTV